MQIHDLDHESQLAIRSLPETGMGFQIVESRTVLGDIETWLILNGDIAVPLARDIELDRWLRSRHAWDRFASWFRGEKLPQLHLRSPEVVMKRSETGRAPHVNEVSESALPARNALIKHSKTLKGQSFHRYSATSNDGRVDPATGSFRPGTYATTSTDLPLAPSGFAAVGRYALPNVLPASFVYTILPAEGTSVHIGTVAPAYGQAGGGVEVCFPEGAKNIGSPDKPKKLPDE